MTKLRVLLSAYACEPNIGSEPEVGWNIVREMAKYNQVWVITRSNNRSSIEAALTLNPVADLEFIYFDLPRWARFWKRGRIGIRLYYYLWQIGIYFIARRLNARIKFDLCHHVTFVLYWAPSFISFLPIPFLWGPVGGGETAPWTFWKNFSIRGKIYEPIRSIARWFAEHDPFVRFTAKRSSLAIATSKETALRLQQVGATNIVISTQVGLSKSDIDTFSLVAPLPEKPIRFISIGNLVHLKGVDLAIRAFAKANLADAEYWIVGDGPERPKLESLALFLGVNHQVHFLGHLPRQELPQMLSQIHALIFPSLHDSGGFAIAEAMAAGRPVICLDLGGPAVQMNNECGFVVHAGRPDQTIEEMSQAILILAQNKERRDQMSRAARQRITHALTAEGIGKTLNDFYKTIVNGQSDHAN